MFASSTPVSGSRFINRTAELERIESAVSQLETGSPQWLLLVGPRKIGKTSLLLEGARRRGGDATEFVVLDAYDADPMSLEFFRNAATAVLDRLLGEQIGRSFTLLLRSPASFRSALQQSGHFVRLPADLRSELLELPVRPADLHLLEFALELPEMLSAALGTRMVLAIDEFQELATIPVGRKAMDVLPTMRRIWQRHQHVSYFVSGSARSMLMDLALSRDSPFFQHFDVIEVPRFELDQSIELLTTNAPKDRPISKKLARRVHETLGGHPFYLQLMGEALTSEPDDESLAVKRALQRLLFSRSGRLSLYFQREFARLVGRSSQEASALAVLAEGPVRLSEIASTMGIPSGATARAIERLGDAVTRNEDGRYQLEDQAFAAWLRWRSPGGSVVPMKLVGDEAELRVAQHLAQMGFELVYQSRASRGAFDLLAIRAGEELAIQVKRSDLPLRFTRTEWQRMAADAKALSWRWIVAAVTHDGSVQLLDPARARKSKEVRLHPSAAIDNLLVWLGG